MVASQMETKVRAQKIIETLAEEYRRASTALRFKTPLEMLVATVLSAQSTDKTINQLTETLFKKYRKPEDYANADLHKLEGEIKSAGLYRNKAKYLKGIGEKLIEEFGSKVPTTMDDLTQLPGVARKTANVVLWNAFRVIEGIAVDTHVRRLAQRLGLTETKDPDKIEKDLMEIISRDKWPNITNLLISHGRRVCTARKPKCQECVLYKLCPSASAF